MSDNDGFWCPTSVDSIHVFLTRAIPRGESVLTDAYAYKRNIAYNLQYLQFLNWTLTETRLHSTVYVLTVKTFIITGISVIESILWYVIKKNGVQPKQEWELAQESVSNPFQCEEITHRHVTQLMRKLDTPLEPDMTLDAMIKKVSSRRLLGVNNELYGQLKYLRKLRNKVHIHAVQHGRETDWWSFDWKQFKLMKSVLGSVLRSPLFDPLPEHEYIIGFLQVSETADQLGADEL